MTARVKSLKNSGAKRHRKSLPEGPEGPDLFWLPITLSTSGRANKMRVAGGSSRSTVWQITSLRKKGFLRDAASYFRDDDVDKLSSFLNLRTIFTILFLMFLFLVSTANFLQSTVNVIGPSS